MPNGNLVSYIVQLKPKQKSIYSTIYKGFCKKVPGRRHTNRQTLKIIYKTSKGTQPCLGLLEKEFLEKEFIGKRGAERARLPYDHTF